mmetsp:Transcript_18687/g.23199  ORF Transcript_18687/g.23199 Transcript_18687/m.23199 type:complete len:96 (+) Transcript_18687:80-367(+)
MKEIERDVNESICGLDKKWGRTSVVESKQELEVEEEESSSYSHYYSVNRSPQPSVCLGPQISQRSMRLSRNRQNSWRGGDFEAMTVYLTRMRRKQ